MADDNNDPAMVWRTMIGEMEKGFNAFANQAMASPEFSRAMNGVGSASAGMQKQFGEMMEKYLSTMNFPSRAQMVDFGERLKTIEGQLNEISALLRRTHGEGEGGNPDQGAALAPRPARTRQPPAGGNKA